LILDKIVERKHEEVADARRKRPLVDVRAAAGDVPPPRDFRRALSERADIALIAEIKRSSPSAGLIREDFDPATIAARYHEGGAAAISVLTDRAFFGGELGYVSLAKEAAPLPVLRKDFVVDEYQVYEARAAGADAVLLIVRILSDEQLVALLARAHELGMAALVETHNADEVERAVRSDAAIIGVNNRDLDSLTIDLATARTLAPGIPADRTVISESGIACRRDIETVAAGGIHAVLVGETLMKSPDLVEAARSLVGVRRHPARA